MTKHNSHAGNEPRTRRAAREDNGAATATAEDGHAEGAPAEAGPAPDDRVRRAEEIVDRLTERLGNFAGRLGLGLRRLAARTREEAEDVWAEARSLSRGEKA